jgi:acetyl esterase/lipase
LSDIVTLMLKATFFLLSCAAYGQLSEKAIWAAEAQNRYVIKPNITYGIQNNFETKLDVYQRRDTTGPQPTMIYIHGGGWTGGSKETAVTSLFPYFEMGWNVVNVEYRLEKISLAPAAVEDCLCALRWIGVHARDYNFDTAKLVLTGDSAGGHLALTTGMIPMSAGLDRQCPGPDLPKVAAILDWYGITDVNDLLDGPNQKGYAVQWLGSRPDKEQIAKRVSPLEYVRPGLPPVLMIQGDQDPTVPYSHSVRLHEALDKVDVPNQLLTIPGGKHGNFTPEERVRIFAATRDFLAKYHLL